MESQRTRYGYVMRMDSGEEIMSTLTDFAEREGVRGGAITGLGAASEAELGFYVSTEEGYRRQEFKGAFEIGALTGNFSILDGRPFPHCHITLSREDFSAITGHLFRAIVSATCEVHIMTDPDPIHRVRDESRNFTPLKLGGR